MLGNYKITKLKKGGTLEETEAKLSYLKFKSAILNSIRYPIKFN